MIKKIMLSIYIILSLFYIVLSLSFKDEDVNKDGKVNSKDMLDLRNYLLEESDINGEN